jgi:hypothetical protein
MHDEERPRSLSKTPTSNQDPESRTQQHSSVEVRVLRGNSETPSNKAGGPLKAAFVYVRSSRLAVSSLRRSEGAPFKPDFGLSGAVPHSNPLRQSTAPAASTSRLPFPDSTTNLAAPPFALSRVGASDASNLRTYPSPKVFHSPTPHIYFQIVTCDLYSRFLN